jgi:hypothetical protein
METQYSPSTLSCDSDNIAYIDREVERFSVAPLTTSLRPTTVDEVRTLIKGLKPRNTPGADGISNCLFWTLRMVGILEVYKYRNFIFIVIFVPKF